MFNMRIYNKFVVDWYSIQTILYKVYEIPRKRWILRVHWATGYGNYSRDISRMECEVYRAGDSYHTKKTLANSTFPRYIKM